MLAYSIAVALPAGQPVDLVRAFVEPWSLAVAVVATGAPGDDAERLAGLAREVFLGAACSTDTALRPQAQEAAAELARSFPAAGASVDVQAFVALSQTLPCFLANAWFALLRHPEEAARLRAQPGLMSQAIEELLRYAGPSRAIFRQASAPAGIGCANIRQGDRVILLLAAANRDPAQFPEPGRLDFRRGAAGHLAFGGGPHRVPVHRWSAWPLPSRRARCSPLRAPWNQAVQWIGSADLRSALRHRFQSCCGASRLSASGKAPDFQNVLPAKADRAVVQDFRAGAQFRADRQRIARGVLHLQRDRARARCMA